jgi:hypothetical protein
MIKCEYFKWCLRMKSFSIIQCLILLILWISLIFPMIIKCSQVFGWLDNDKKHYNKKGNNLIHCFHWSLMSQSEVWESMLQIFCIYRDLWIAYSKKGIHVNAWSIDDKSFSESRLFIYLVDLKIFHFFVFFLFAVYNIE